MGFLNNILEYLAVFVAGFFGHVVAHDFCEVVPTISKKIVKAAASQLPASIRDRYLDEWLADLWDQPGAIAKLKWSLGCVLSATRMSREAKTAEAKQISVEFVLESGKTVMVDLPTFWVFFSAMKFTRFVVPWIKWMPVRAAAFGVLATMSTSAFRWRRCGQPDFDSAIELLGYATIGTTKLRTIRRYKNGVLIPQDIDE